MNTLTNEMVKEVSGGNLLAKIIPAIGAGTATYLAPSEIYDATKKMGDFGKELSQKYWDYKYPYDPNSNDTCYGPRCKKK